MSDEPVKTPVQLQQKMILDEIFGKNNAIQTYDQQLWTIRSGFLTLLFAGWGALLALAGENTKLLVPVTTVMLFVSWGLAIAGLCIDRNYVTRKFRCIYALKSLLSEAFEKIDNPEQIKNREEWLRVSGDDSYIRIEDTDLATPYKLALRLSYLLYIMPPFTITLGIFVAWPLLRSILKIPD